MRHNNCPPLFSGVSPGLVRSKIGQATFNTLLKLTLVWFILIVEQRLGGDPATLANTAAIEVNTQAIEQMRDSFDVLAGQLERMREGQEEEEAGEEGR